MTPEEFRDKVKAAVERAHPGLKATPKDAFTLELSNGMVMYLHNFYQTYQASPGNVDRLMETIAGSLPSIQGPEIVEVDFEAARPKIMPLIKPRDFVEDTPKGLQLTFSPFTTRTVIAYVLDAKKHIAFVNETMRERWGKTTQELRSLACENLLEYKKEMKAHALGGDKVEAIVLQTLDGYDATRVLLPNFWERISPHLGNEFLVGIPNRDFLIAFSTRDKAFARATIAQIRKDFRKQPYAVTDEILHVTEFGIVAHDEPPLGG